MNDLIEEVISAFFDNYGFEPEVVAIAPGRVNLIGEHTDYTGGFVLPAAINREIVIAAGKKGGDTIRGFSVNFHREAFCRVGKYDPAHPVGWFRYIVGVLKELEKIGRGTGCFCFTVGGNIPIGSGLSSSAALETAMLTAIEGLYEFRMDDTEAALLCQRAENLFVGVNCGIMDQLVSRAGQMGMALFIDCASLEMKPVPAEIPGNIWVVIDSRKRRGLVDSEYNRRRRECEEAVVCAQKAFPERCVTGLRDVYSRDFPALEKVCPDIVFRRLRHIVTENDRVLRMAEVLSSQDTGEIEKLLAASHLSMRDDFEISCVELDFLVEILSGIEGVHGARLTGAGFGGCVIAFAESAALPRIEKEIAKKYHPEGISQGAAIWPIEISEGARRIKKI
jgi:galactokinase